MIVTSRSGISGSNCRHDRTGRTFVPGRDVRFRAPPGQFRASPIRALGSYLGCLTAKRTLGQGCRIRGGGRNSSASLNIEYLRAYLKRLPDFEDFEAEPKAFAIAAALRS